MESYTNDKGEVVVIKDMEARRLIHAIAKYSRLHGALEMQYSEYEGTDGSPQIKSHMEEAENTVKALKDEAIKRLTNEHGTN